MDFLKKYSRKQLILGAIICTVALFAILTLVFNIISTKATLLGTTLRSSANGFSILGEVPGAIEDIGGWLITYSILYMLAVVAGIGFLAFCFVKKSVEEFLSFGEKTNIAACALALIYMINGIVAVSVANDETMGLVDSSTAAFVPFIIIALLTVAFYVVKVRMPEQTAPAAETEEPAEEENAE